jgi:hypothetical protein
MKKLLLAMTALTAVGLYGAKADVLDPNAPVFVGPTAISAGASFGTGWSSGSGFALGKGTAGTSSGGIAGYSSIGQGGATTLRYLGRTWWRRH